MTSRDVFSSTCSCGARILKFPIELSPRLRRRCDPSSKTMLTVLPLIVTGFAVYLAALQSPSCMVYIAHQRSSIGVRYRCVHVTWPLVGSSTAAKCVHSLVVGHADIHEIASSLVTVTESSMFVMSRAASVCRKLCFVSAFTSPDLVVIDPKLAAFDSASLGSARLSDIRASRFILRSAFRTLLFHLSAMHFLLCVLSLKTSAKEASSGLVESSCE
jgi:hypothetical protein